jgi:mRNA-degrading endonuclease RelE of RelBE toxin-antitoxin system
MKYEVEFKPRAIKDLRKIEKAYHKKNNNTYFRISQ